MEANTRLTADMKEHKETLKGNLPSMVKPKAC